MAELNEREKKATVHLFGKPYHWTINDEGKHSLKEGPTEYEKIRWDVVQRMIDKGVPAESITAEMIDEVVAKAESAAIMEAVSGE